MELTPLNRKSFYDKAKMINESGVIKLKSYDTIVAQYDPQTKKVTVNGWYSTTTARHINAFLVHFGFNKMSKAEMQN